MCAAEKPVTQHLSLRIQKVGWQIGSASGSLPLRRLGPAREAANPFSALHSYCIH